jgi:Bacterial Ig-like domain
MQIHPNFPLLVATILMLIMPVSVSLADGQKNVSTSGQQPAATSGQAPVITYNVNPPPNPVIQQPSPPLPQAVTNNTSQPGQRATQITNPIVFTIAFVGAAAGVIYRTIYPYFERLHEMEVKGEDPVKFLTKYKFTFGISLLISLVTTIGLFSGILQQVDIGAGLGMIFISSFVQGIGWNELTNRVSYKITDRTTDQAAARKKQPSFKSTAKEIIGVEEKDQGEQAPNIISRYPMPDQTDISITTPIAVSFSKPMDKSTITNDIFILRKDGSTQSIEPKEIKLEENGQTVLFKAKEDFEKNTKYIATVSKQVKDEAGNKMVSDETWSFTTMS